MSWTIAPPDERDVVVISRDGVHIGVVARDPAVAARVAKELFNYLQRKEALYVVPSIATVVPFDRTNAPAPAGDDHT